MVSNIAITVETLLHSLTPQRYTLQHPPHARKYAKVGLSPIFFSSCTEKRYHGLVWFKSFVSLLHLSRHPVMGEQLIRFFKAGNNQSRKRCWRHMTHDYPLEFYTKKIWITTSPPNQCIWYDPKQQSCSSTNQVLTHHEEYFCSLRLLQNLQSLFLMIKSSCLIR